MEKVLVVVAALLASCGHLSALPLEPPRVESTRLLPESEEHLARAVLYSLAAGARRADVMKNLRDCVAIDAAQPICNRLLTQAGQVPTRAAP